MLREIETALGRADNIPVIPVILPEADISELPEYLKERQWADLRGRDVVAEAGKLADYILSLR